VGDFLAQNSYFNVQCIFAALLAVLGYLPFYGLTKLRGTKIDNTYLSLSCPCWTNFSGLLILSVPFTELNVLCWSELTRRKLSPMLAPAHHSGPDSAIAQCELSGYVKLG